MRIVIIEDENLTARNLERTIKAVNPSAEIIAILNSVEESVDFLEEENSIDLIFSDIQLGDGVSFEIFENLNRQVPIIYCTAFDKYALDAFKTFGIDYILKPFSEETVRKALEKFDAVKNSFTRKPDDYSKLMSILKQGLEPNQSSSIIVQKGDAIIPLKVADIALFFIAHDVVFAYTFDGKKHTLPQKLSTLEETYTPTFFRVNRQFLINRKAVKDAAHHFNRKLLVNLNIPFDKQILVGKVKVTSFLNWLKKG